MTEIKICGVTTFEDALAAAQAGAGMLGLNFHPPSPRSITPSQAGMVTAMLRVALREDCPLLVGVFVNEMAGDIVRVVEMVGLDLAQLSGDEPVEVLADLRELAVKAIRPRSRDEAVALAETYLPYAPSDERLPSLLLDAYHPDLYGGTGERASTEIALAVKGLASRLMLAGGLNPQNVAERVETIRPWGVDVASGVEGAIKGRKDPDRVRSFVEAVRAVMGES